MNSLYHALAVHLFVTCVESIESATLSKVSIDPMGNFDRSKKMASSRRHGPVSIDPMDHSFDRSKKMTRSERMNIAADVDMSRLAEAVSSSIMRKDDSIRPELSIPALGNFYGASLLVNRTHLRVKEHVQNAGTLLAQRFSAKPSTVASSDSVWINKTTYESSLVVVLFVFMIVGFVLSGVIFAMSYRSRGADVSEEPITAVQEDGGSGATNSDDVPRVEKLVKRSPEGLDEDLYGMGIAALIRDTQRFAMKTELLWLRVGRLAITLLVLIFTMTLQVFLLVEMKILVTSVSTHEARDIYDKYEVWMYGNNTADMTVTSNGYHRGKDGNFDVSRFKTLDDDTKDSACQMPLSQPTFFIAILLVWSLVCVAEVRRTFDLAGSLIVATPTIDSMKDSCQDTEEQGDEAVLVVGLTLPVKIVAGVCILVPRMVVSAILLWLGCRWLTGTMGFSDVLQNAVTLEFILLLKDLFYQTMAPHHNKTETRNTLLLPFADKERPSVSIFLGAFLWGVIAIMWVLLYIEAFQQVLPEYRWDIHDACADYLASVEQSTPDGF